MSDNRNGMKNATDSLSDHTDGIDETNTDATNDNEANADNGTNTPEIDSISNDIPETNNGNRFPFRQGQVDWDARCPDCGRFWHDTRLLRLVRSIGELVIQSHGMEDAGERCRWCLRLRVYCDYQEQALEADNDPEMVDSELDLFTDLEQLSAGPVAPFLDSLFGADPLPDGFEVIYDADDEAESESSGGGGESDFE